MNSDRIKLALSAANIGIWEYDPINNILIWDDTMYRIYGVSSDKFAGAYEAWESALHPDDLDRSSKELQLALNEKKEFDTEFRIVWPNQSIHYIKAKAIVNYDDAGKAIRMIGTNQDITDKKKADDKFKALMESAPDALVIVNDKGIIQLVNAQTEKIFGYTKPELIGQKVEILIPDRFKKNHHHHRDGFFSNPNVRPMGAGLELWGQKKSGDEFPIEISLSPLETEEGTLVSAAIRDITQRKKAEDKFRALMEAAPDALVIVNDQGLIQLVNAQTEKIFGYTKPELIGQKVEILIPDRFKKNHHNHRDGFFSNPNVRPMGAGLELWGQKKSGEEFPIEISLSPLETEEGILVSAAIRDITQRKKAEDKFRALMESAPDALVIVNDKGIIQLVNAQTEKIFGYTKPELIGQKVEILIPDRFKKNHHHHRDGFFSNPNVRPMGAGLELWGQKKSGDEFPIEISLSPLETEEGTLVSAAIRDVTDRKKVSLELIKLNEEQRESIDIVSEQNKRLINFAHIVSHNLRSHSGNFGMLLNLYRDEKEEDEKKVLIDLLESASDQLAETIKNLNEVVSVQININEQRQAIVLKHSIENVVDIVRAEINKFNAIINIDIAADLIINYVPSYLESILLNLLTNCIKYSHPNRKPIITFKAYKLEDRLILEVTDNGVGIDLERNKDKLFGMYKTFHGNNDARGIGLFITKNQVEAMGGKIEVQSEINVGSTFKIYLS